MASVVPMPPELAEISTAELDGCLEATRAPPSPATLLRVMKAGGRALQSVLSSSSVAISSPCREALQRMADSGETLDMRFVVELEKCGALSDCVVTYLDGIGGDTVKELAELREAVSSCAMATLASKPDVDLLALWSVVHNSTSAAITEEAAALMAQAETEIPKALEDIEDTLTSLGRLLHLALLSSAALAGTASAELRAAVEQLAREGTPMAEHLVQELRLHLDGVREALSAVEWQELRKLCAQALGTSWCELGGEADRLAAVAAENVGVVQGEVDKVFNSPFAQAVAARGASLATGALTYSREFVDAALDAARDGRVIALTGIMGWVDRIGLPPLLRLEIARDFFQTAGLFFAGLYVPLIAYFSDQDIGNNMRAILRGFGRFYDVFAVNVSAFIQDGSSAADVFVVFLLMGITAVWISYLWFWKTGRHMHSRVVEIRHGHEATTWAALAVRQATRVKMFTYVITASLTVYLPLTRLCLDVLAAVSAPPMDGNSNHYGASDLVIARLKNSSGWWFAVLMACVVLLTFTLTLPWTFYDAIRKNQPTGSQENTKVTHNLDGEKVEFTDKVYARLVTKDPSQLRCPYRSLYAGFGQRSSHYKVTQLAIKIALAFLIVCTTRASAGVRGGLICALYFFVMVFTIRGKHFTDPMNNVQEISSKVAAFTVGFCAAVTIGPGSLRGWGGLTVFAQVLNLVVMVSVLLLGMKRTRLWMKDKTGFLSFSDTSTGIEDARANDIVPQWNVEKELKHRVWQAFWRATLLELTEPKLGKDYSGVTIANRLADLEEAVVASGAHRVVSHWRGEDNTYTARLRQAILEILEGVDVFWGDLDAPRNGRSGFGKMYVKPYPFHCVIVYDDPVKPLSGVGGEADKDVVTLRDDYDPSDSSSTHRNLAKLFFLNFSPRVIARREVRQKLRALSALATSIRFPFVQEEEVVLEDGIVEKRRFGKTYTETRMTKVKFKCYYTWGVVCVETEGDGFGKKPRIMAEGFSVSMTYRDGQGDAVAPNTGIVHHLKHRATVKGPDHIGLTQEMEESAELRRIFAQTGLDWVPGVNKLRSQEQQYRRRLAQKHRRGNETLSDGFWYELYNQPHLSRSKLERHLRTREINPQLRNLPRTHADALDALFLRLRYVYSHPAVGFWYVFWDDVYARNGEMKKLRDHKALLDPQERTSLCYRVMKRKELEACLEARQLLGRKGYFVPRLLELKFDLVDPTKVHLPRRLFEPKLLDLLYTTLSQHVEAAKRGKTPSEMEDDSKNNAKGLAIRNQVRQVLHIGKNDKDSEQRDAVETLSSQ